MRTLSITAFVATLFPPLLLSSAPEPRETPRLYPAKLELEPISPISPALAITKTTSAVPIASALPPEAPTALETPTAQAARATSPIDEELHCLALNIYHEARSEPLSGQIAVAQVTLNRVASKSFPHSVCEVVKQGGQKRNRCQFSWWCDGKSDQPTEMKAWRKSLDLGRRVLAEQMSDPTDGALFYHATYVSPKWSRSFQRTTQIGRHLFYRPTSSARQS
ncbi:cell wall hydrolase [Halochromatium roseum]|uniref:cell wall hydrolase n=1 Tax=Halochromatium roseum TaxID=391920 RepID=UPI001913E514|nr:cell wall hydrolase [Halochromatium roseum]MBK5940226.1 cell wall hydrolase [Halochromatium roseum]